MNLFYEQEHSSNTNHLWVAENYGENFQFPLHLHGNYEFVCVEEGVLCVEINHCRFDVACGEGALILPNQPHKFSTPAYSKSWLAIFSPDHIPELKKITDARGCFHPVICCDSRNLREQMLVAQNDPLRIRSILYALAARYCEGGSAPQLVTADGALACRVVEYVHAHYAEPMTLETMAQALGYSYRYLSGVINRFFGMPLPQVVNRYRINDACDLLLHSEMEITEIALSCGFGSMRNFNRNFKAVTDLTPREYRNRKK